MVHANAALQLNSKDENCLLAYCQAMIGSDDLQKEMTSRILIGLEKSPDKGVRGKAGFLRALLEERSDGDCS